MANADSTIRVNIIGDAKSLEAAAARAEKAGGKVAGTFKKIGVGIAAGLVANEVLDFTQDAIKEADRLGDATARLEEQLGDLADPLIANAGHFAHLGQSAQDMLELEARFADIATSAGVMDDEIGPAAQSAAEIAAAMSLLSDQSADVILDQIGKAAAGADRPLKDLGISVSDAEVEARALRDTGKENAEALTDQELAAARMMVILEKLTPRIEDVTGANADLETKQAAVQAKFETLTGKIGAAIEGPLNELLEWILAGIEGWELFAFWIDKNEQELREFLAPLARAVDLLNILTELVGGASGMSLGLSIGGGVRNQNASGFDQRDVQSGGVTVNVNGGDPVEVQRAVTKALDAHRRQNNL